VTLCVPAGDEAVASVLVQGNRFGSCVQAKVVFGSLNPQAMFKPLRFIEKRQNVGR
jgi:hypothetical protein